MGRYYFVNYLFIYLIVDAPVFDSESQLISSLHAGSHSAFTAVYEQLYKRLYFFALRFVSEKDAEDVTAESFITLWNKKSLLHTLDAISAYMHVLVRNRCYNLVRDQHLRHDKRAELLNLLENQGPEDHMLEQVRIELIELIYRQLDQLPSRMRDIFLLSYRHGLKPAQIAERLDISVRTVSNQKLNAVKLLKAALSRENQLGILMLLLQFEAGAKIS